jgi:ABC-type polysaccharide/polyol phosphate transport system ATPase subunit
MPDKPAITVSGVSKHYTLTGSATRSLKATLLDTLRRRRAPHPVVKALDNVSFAVARGSTLGIIGANGAGKSTLLALLTKTIQPTFGEVHTVGTVSSLLELGAGFHPDLTGRENVFLYGAIMGLSRRQMLKRFDAIVQFADLHAYIDQPVKHYSSGMYVRLGFAVAVEVDPDILLIDEVLAVGDANFQRKCIAKIQAFRAQGKTMLIISHDLPTIQRVSNQILLLDKGRIMGIGQPESMIDQYQAIARERNRKGLEREWGTGDVLITGVDFLTAAGAPAQTFQWGQPLCARVHFEARQAVTDPVFGFAIADEEGRLVYGSNTQIESLPIARIEGPGRLLMKLDRVLMAAGTYLFSFSVHSADHKTNFHRLDNCFSIQVESEKNFEGYCYMPSHWSRES